MGKFSSRTLGVHEATLTGVADLTPGAAVADPDAMTSSATSSVEFDSTELDEVRADVLEVRAQLIALLTSLRAAGLLES